MTRAAGALRRWLAGRDLPFWAATAGLVVLAGTGRFGGLEPAAAEHPPLTVGRPYAAAPFEITLQRVVATTELGQVGRTKGRFLVVVGTVRTLGDAPVRPVIAADPLRQAVTIAGPDGILGATGAPPGPAEGAAPKGVYVLADSSVLDIVQPGLTYQVGWVWEQEPGRPLPAELSVGLVGHTQRPSSIDDVVGWRDPTPGARVTLPVAVPTPSPAAPR